MRRIVVVPYDAQWQIEFNKAKAFYEKVLDGLDVTIEHVGSTSVKGLHAKPILDIDIIVADSGESKKVIDLLAKVGYKHEGDMGIPGREVLKYDEDNPFIDWMTHHLYVCITGGENLENHLMLRDFLRGNPWAIEEYSNLKMELAKKYPEDIDSYVEGKTALITGYLEKQGLNNDALKRIRKINEKE